MPLKTKLKLFAKSIGINYLGVTSAAPLYNANDLPQRPDIDVFSNHTGSGNPTDLLADAHSVICVAWPCALPPATPTPQGGRGQVARYAWGRDYHIALREKLVELAYFLQKNAPTPTTYLICVDNNALAEKALAARAGLGWFGKNSLLIVPQVGSWVTLGEIITTTILEPDAPCTYDGCGSCHRCLAACPTKALDPTLTHNWKRCLSYITQMRGPIPLDLRPMLGRRIWGCDTCQAACPYNQGTFTSAFSSPVANEVAWPDLLELLTMNTATFTVRYGQSALHWRGKNTIQRNAAIALGNWGEPSAVPVLINCLRTHASPLVRGACAWALGQIASSQAFSALHNAASQEKHPQVIQEITIALNRYHHEAMAENNSTSISGTSCNEET